MHRPRDYRPLIRSVSARARRKREEREAFVTANPTLYGSLQERGKVELEGGATVSLQSRLHEGVRKTELVYRTPEYTANVRVLPDLLGHGERYLQDQDVRSWVPPGPGRYWIGDGDALYVLEDAKPHGEIRKFFCRFRIHRKRRIRGYRNRVWQCPYCLKLKIRRPPAPKVVAVVVGDSVLAGEMHELRLHFSDARVPSGSGKKAWAAVGMRGLGEGRYGGSLDDAIDQLV